MKGIIEVRPVIMGRHDLCVRPYPNHKNGCPNYGKKKGCPPGVPMFDMFYDLSKSVYAIYNKFDFKGHVNRMKERHPDWSKRRLECCLYWQGTARKQLKERIEIFKSISLTTVYDYVITTVPEAMGVNVTETMKRVGIELEWFPVNVAYQIAMAGIVKKERKLLSEWTRRDIFIGKDKSRCHGVLLEWTDEVASFLPPNVYCPSCNKILDYEDEIIFHKKETGF